MDVIPLKAQKVQRVGSLTSSGFLMLLLDMDQSKGHLQQRGDLFGYIT